MRVFESKSYVAVWLPKISAEFSLVTSTPPTHKTTSSSAEAETVVGTKAPKHKRSERKIEIAFEKIFFIMTAPNVIFVLFFSIISFIF